MQSAHTDYGYTFPQELVKQMYVESYDRVLELCQQTENDPAERRFKWTCETFWQVENYLTACPERLDDFLYFVRNGQIEITATYLHFTDLIDADACRKSVQRAVNFCKQHHLPLTTALHCDINGWPWALADVLAEQHIPFFCSFVHMDRGTDPLGRRGSTHYQFLEGQESLRADAPIRIPQSFDWVGPRGGQVLHWLNEHYLLGNVLGLSSMTWFHSDKTRFFYERDILSADAIYDIAQRELPRYIARLRQDRYPYPALLLNTGGFYIDNSPPDDRWLDVIARWNKEHTDIRLISAIPSEWYIWLNAQTLPLRFAHQTAWPDHWAHGLGSMTMRIAQARHTQRRRTTVEAAVAKLDSETARQHLESSFVQELLSLEHTFSAWSTTVHPEASVNDFQQSVKETMFHTAELLLDEAAMGGLRNISRQKEEQPALWVYTPEVGTHTVQFAAGDLNIDPESMVLIDKTGSRCPIQSENSRLGQYVAVLPLIANDLNSFSILPVTSDVPKTPPTPKRSLENEFWYIEADEISGGLRSLYDRTIQREWVDPTHNYGFGQVVHESVIHPSGRDAVGNPARFAALDTATEATKAEYTDISIFARQPLSAKDIGYQAGPVFDSLVIQGSEWSFGSLTWEWRLYHQVPLVELSVEWQKTWCDLPEAAYIAFPFAANQCQLMLDTSGGYFQPGSHQSGGQLMGTCCSYYTVQSGAKIVDPINQQTLYWLPIDAPLVMPQEINFNRWEVTEPWAWNGFIASMPVNHYWQTNFPTSQRGYIRLRYRLFSPSSPAWRIHHVLPLAALGWR